MQAGSGIEEEAGRELELSSGVGINFRSFRRAERALDVDIVRELSEEDLLIRQMTEVGSIIPNVKTLRSTHHKLAQILASGFTETEASISTGYSPSRISILKGDPAFKELLVFYGGKREEIYVDVVQRMAGFATSAVEVLQERLEEKPEAFSNRDLNELLKTTADRGGFSPVHKVESKTLVLDASALLQLKTEVEATQNETIRRINQVEEASAVKLFLEGKAEGGEPCLGENDNGDTSAVSDEA